jgi:hypothetical protein
MHNQIVPGWMNPSRSRYAIQPSAPGLLTKLSHEATDHVILFVERLIADDIAILVDSNFQCLL